MQSQGFAVSAEQHLIEYLEPAVFGDELEVSTWLSDVTPTSALRHYCIVRVDDGALITRARSRWGILDLKSEERIPIPQPFLDDLGPSISDPLAPQ
jgi:acyl-CoA thioester hydrolase